MLFYRGHKITPYDYYEFYKEGDCIQYQDKIYQCRIGNRMNYPYSHTYYWRPIPEEKQEEEMKTICGNHIGNISGDNVVVYGNNTGDISANGNKSVVVVFGNVIGNITAEQVARFDNLYKEAIKEIALKTQGKNND